MRNSFSKEPIFIYQSTISPDQKYIHIKNDLLKSDSEARSSFATGLAHPDIKIMMNTTGKIACFILLDIPKHKHQKP